MIVMLFSVLLIACCVRLIAYLLDPPIQYELDRKNSVVSDEDIYNYGSHFKTFSISNKENFEYKSDSLSIKYDGYTLKINEKVFEDVTSLYDFFSIYDDTLLVISYVADETMNVFVYNFKNGEEKFINKYNDMIIDLDSSITFDDDGITLSFTSIKDGKFIKNKKDICKDKDKSKKVIKTVLYKYKSDECIIDGNAELYSMSLLTYLNKYNLCE